jgi:hypothetical protein
MIYRSLILTAWVVLVTLVVGEALPRESAGWRCIRFAPADPPPAAP